jgi:hypothetical protein
MGRINIIISQTKAREMNAAILVGQYAKVLDV